MKIFVDTANLDDIKELASWGVIDGVTTNPTLIAKSGRSFNEILKEIFQIINGPISLEVVSEKADEMINEAKKLVEKIPKKYQKNITIKIPMTPEGLKAVTKLKDDKIKTNVKSTNWYVLIGNMIIAGCQIHYAIQTDAVSFEPALSEIDFEPLIHMLDK